MDAQFYPALADRIRQIMATARTDAARRQLAIWLEEFDQRTAAAEQENPTGSARETEAAKPPVA